MKLYLALEEQRSLFCKNLNIIKFLVNKAHEPFESAIKMMLCIFFSQTAANHVHYTAAIFIRCFPF